MQTLPLYRFFLVIHLGDGSNWSQDGGPWAMLLSLVMFHPARLMTIWQYEVVNSKEDDLMQLLQKNGPEAHMSDCGFGLWVR